MSRIIVVMRGGLIEAVFANADLPMPEVVVIDWDDLDAVGYELDEYDPTSLDHKLIHEPVVLPLEAAHADVWTVLDRYDRAPSDPSGPAAREGA